MKRLKLILAVCIGVLLTLGMANIYWVQIANRFEVVSEGKVYKSGVMSEKKLQNIIEKYDIKTIVDLRKPKDITAIEKERAFVGTLGVNHVNIPSDQIPKDETVQKFLTIMDDEESYPVLIHCEHGEGRAVLFAALYRIEYENWDNDKARCDSRVITYGTSFSLNAPKGKYLLDYAPLKKNVPPAFPAGIYTDRRGESLQGK